MFTKHVSSLTSAYCDDELSPEQSRQVAEHLIGCRRCRGNFEEIKFGARLAAQLPLMLAGDSPAKVLRSKSKEVKNQSRGRGRPRLREPRKLGLPSP